MGVATDQPWNRISVAFCVQLVYIQVLVLVYTGRATVGTGYTHALAAYSEVATNHCCFLYSISAHAPTVFLPVIYKHHLQAHLRASCLRLRPCTGCQVQVSCKKILLMVALNYSVPLGTLAQWQQCFLALKEISHQFSTASYVFMMKPEVSVKWHLVGGVLAWNNFWWILWLITLSATALCS